MSRIYLIRHGKPASSWGEAGSDPDPGLDEAGRAQAQAVSDALAALPQDHRPRSVVSSPLRRCLETARPLALKLGVSLVPEPMVAEIPTPGGLTEMERGSWLRAAFGGLWTAVPGDIDYDAWRRSVARRVAAYDGAAIFTHFVAINAAVSVALQTQTMIAFRPDHASITILEADGDGLRLIEQGRSAATEVL